MSKTLKKQEAEDAIARQSQDCSTDAPDDGLSALERAIREERIINRYREKENA